MSGNKETQGKKKVFLSWEKDVPPLDEIALRSDPEEVSLKKGTVPRAYSPLRRLDYSPPLEGSPFEALKRAKAKALLAKTEVLRKRKGADIATIHAHYNPRKQSYEFIALFYNNKKE